MSEAMSPFLPGTKVQFAWDSTSLGWLKTCPRLYQYSMIEGWRSSAKSVHLEFGGLYHSGLEMYDKQRSAGAEHDDALRAVVEWLLKQTWVRPEGWTGNKCPTCSGHGLRTESDGEERQCTFCGGTGDEYAEKPGHPVDWEHNLKTRETLIRSVIWYLEQFDGDTCETVQLANGKPAVELSFRMELDWGPGWGQTYGPSAVDGAAPQPYVLCGHLDRVVKFQENFYVMDRKTSSTTIGSYYFDQYDPDNQMSLYSLAARVIYQTPVRGVIIDAAQIAVGFSRFSRGFTFRTEAQIEEWLANTRQWLRLAEAFAQADFWPMNDRSCHQYGGCAFRRVCSKSPEVRDKFLQSGFTKRHWNPLEPR